MATREKLVDRWTYKYTGVSHPDADGADEDAPVPAPVVGDRVAEVELRLLKETRESDEAPYPLTKASFAVVCKEPPFRFVGTDVEALRVAAWAELDKAFKIRWTPWYLVSLHADSYRRAPGAGMTFTYETVEKGVAHDGTELLREYPSFKTEPRISPWPGRFTDQNGRVKACVEVTEANTAAMENFAKGIDDLRKRIAAFLKPENIEDTIARLAFGGFAGAIAAPREDA